MDRQQATDLEQRQATTLVYRQQATDSELRQATTLLGGEEQRQATDSLGSDRQLPLVGQQRTATGNRLYCWVGGAAPGNYSLVDESATGNRLVGGAAPGLVNRRQGNRLGAATGQLLLLVNRGQGNRLGAATGQLLVGDQRQGN